MGNDRTIARPYAKAIFELAQQKNQLLAWSRLLILLAKVASNAEMQSLYRNPKVSPSQLGSIFIDLLMTLDLTDPDYKNLILVLAEYRRLNLLPVISEMFEEDKAKLEKTEKVTITSALPVPETLRQRLKKALEIRLQCAVTVDFLLDKNLLGGATICAGDLVIDRSVRSMLNKLKQWVVI